MQINKGLEPFTIALTAIVFLQSLFSTDFWITPVSARYYCDSFWVRQPDPNDVVWLPYRTYCPGAQTMSSNPSWWLVDDYPDEDLLNCDELSVAREKARLESGSICIWDPAVETVTKIVHQSPIACNGNVSLPEKDYFIGTKVEIFDQTYDVVCPGYPTSSMEISVGTKYFVREPVGPEEPINGKNLGAPSCGLSAGNPVNIATGNKFDLQQDALLPGGLVISRYYNSSDSASHSFGKGWRGSFSRRIGVAFSNSQLDASLTVVRDDGAENYWRIENGVPKAPPDASEKLDVVYLDGDVLGFSLVTKNQSIETYDANGKLLSITNEDGEVLNLTYSGSRLSKVTAPSGRALSYSYQTDGRVDRIISSNGSAWKYYYDDAENLSRVEFPDGAAKTYHYEDDRFPNALTGVTDENGNRTRSWAYDDSGRAILSTYGDAQSAVQRHTLSYNADGTTTTTGPLQNAVDHSFKARHGVFKFDTASSACGGCGNSIKSTTYDQHGNRDRVTDFADNVTDYEYSPDNLLQSVTYAVGSPQQFEVNYTWDPDLRKPSQIARASKVTGYTYNARGQVLTKNETDIASMASRSWTYTYFETPALAPLVGKLKSIDGPRTDVADLVQYEYYTSNHPGGDYRVGDLSAVINPLGHRTEYLKYDGNGRLQEYADINGVITSITHHPRGWKTSITLNGETTRFTYDKAGNLTGSVQPDGSLVSYEYDDFQRLTALEDGLGNRIEYMLDAFGNRVSERTFDDLGVLRRQLGRVYNSLNQLAATIGGHNGETRYQYDGNGNLTGIVDAGLNTTGYEYDALRRLVKIIDPALGETSITLDSKDNPLSIKDPMGNVTQFGYDGLDNNIDLDSPDTGKTSYEYDDAGNRIASTDARGVRTEFTFDAMNRLLEVSYPDRALDVVYGYDEGAFGKGRLTSMIDAAGTVEYVYDPHGNRISETRTIGGDQFVTSFTYNPADQLVQITYPSGMVIDYQFDTAGQVTSILKTAGSVTETLIDSVEYAPFGPVTSFTYGNGSSFSSSLNLDFEPGKLHSGPGLDWSLSRDALGNVVAITDHANRQKSQSFAYDDLYRLGSAQGDYGLESYTYDANGNRTRFVSNSTDEAYTYEPQSGRLATRGNWSFTRDANGNRTGKLNTQGLGQFYEFGDDSRLLQAAIRDDSGDYVLGDYRYSGHGQRVEKSTPDEHVYYVYGLSGELLGEYSANENGPFTEYVYLDSRPIAAIRHKAELTAQSGAELILDNGDPGTSSTGDWSSKTGNGSLGEDYLLANKASGRTYRWSATPPAADYEVYAWWVGKRNQSDSVAYNIRYGTGEIDTVTMSHKTGGGNWQLLGKYYSIDGQDYVEVSSGSDKFVADAIRWVEVKEPEINWSETTNFIHFDHLGTPRQVTDQNQSVIWSWDSTPFGDSQPNQDPDGDLQDYVLNLRFPGQYYDAETGLHYNYFRTYDPGMGRYIESDPIGLNGGLNTYSYVSARPLQLVDPTGLVVRGDWIKDPKVNIVKYGITGVKPIAPYVDRWGYLKSLGVSGYALGYVNLDIRCSDTEDCGEHDWEIHEQIAFSYSGSKNLGPNIVAAGVGSIAGPLAGAATGIFTFGASSLTALLELLQDAKSFGGDKVQWLYSIGPDVICKGFSQ